MSDGVDYDIEAIREFRSRLESFSNAIEDLRSRLDSAVSAAASDWQDSQFEKAAEHATAANAQVSSALGSLYPDAMAFIEKQEAWHAQYTGG